ncbi:MULTISPECIES: CPBP family intramembrane glutamic endopeptidase [Leuconostoc]|uniref:CPBP family intramembrane glutamic endopeptidase n=1 Tax=Leuconostoc TaxID=1243 RepID=UPI0032DFB1EF
MVNKKENVFLIKGVAFNVIISLLFSFFISIGTFLIIIFNKETSLSKLMIFDNIDRLAIAILLLIIFYKYQDNYKIKERLILNIKFSPSVVYFSIFSLITFNCLFYFSNHEINGKMYLYVVISMLLTGISEEIVYRVISMNLYKDFSLLTIVAQGLIFALIGHGGINDLQNNILIRFPLGVILGLIYKKTNNLWYGSVAHGMYNTAVYINLI